MLNNVYGIAIKKYYLNNVVAILYVVVFSKKYSVKDYVAVSLIKRSTQFSPFFA